MMLAKYSFDSTLISINLPCYLLIQLYFNIHAGIFTCILLDVKILFQYIVQWQQAIKFVTKHNLNLTMVLNHEHVILILYSFRIFWFNAQYSTHIINHLLLAWYMSIFCFDFILIFPITLFPRYLFPLLQFFTYHHLET